MKKYVCALFISLILPPGAGRAAEGSAVLLGEKAARLERVLRERHVHQGLVRELALNEPGRPEKGGTLHPDDNDGLWTALYVAAMSLKYAVTRDSETRRWAEESFRALERLEEVTGIPGFPARSIAAAGEPARNGYDGEWRADASGKWEWKGDTSSDELDGHFFAAALYHDLSAGEEGKARAAGLVKRIMDHIIEHQWYLVDADGRPTRWGVWNPEQLNKNIPLPGAADIDWRQERGLNSLEVLSHLKVAFHLTGDAKYQEKYLDLIERHGYARNTLDGPVIDPDDVNHSDVELAFCAYYPLLKYEKDEKLLKIYRASLEKTWRTVRWERNPWWNFTRCAFVDGDCAAQDSLRTLREIPLEQINWRKDNRGRAGVRIDRRRKNQSAEVLPYDQICIQRWNGNPYLLDSGSDGKVEGDGVLFLLPYWMGRHHGLILD